MSLPSQLQGLSEVKSALAADLGGRVIGDEPTAPGAGDAAAVLAVSTQGFAAAGGLAKLGTLSAVLVKGPHSSTVTAIRADALLHVTVDPATTTAQVERALKEWAGAGAARGHAPVGARGPSTPTPPKPVAAQPAAARPPVPPAPARAAAQGGDPWGALRRALGRGQLNEAVTYKDRLCAGIDGERPGSEPIDRETCDRALRALLDGIGSTLAGDGVGGARALEPFIAPSQSNLSFRWLALLWSARASLKSGAAPSARSHVQEALTTARQLDIEARALSQWVAAEVLAQDGDPTRALSWLAEARTRFEKVGDRWGMGQTWLSEARILMAVKREPEAAEGARQAAALLPDSEDPHVLLARLAVIRDDLAAATEILRPLKTQAAERVRALILAIQGGQLTRPDAAEFLREQEAAPNDRAIRALERIGNAAPRFSPVRETLAWMLLRLGRYDDAGTVFRGILSQPLSPADRASVMLGLGCVANAQASAGAAPAQLRAVVAAGSAPARPSAAPDVLPPLSTSALLSRTPHSGTADAVFSGQLSSFALPDLLEFLRSSKRTGLLVCSSASGMGALRFRDGWVTGAASPSTPGIGQILVLARKIKPEALSQIAAALGPDQPDPVVGERLVKDGVVEAAIVRAGFEKQIRFALRELMLWTDGEFTFNREDAGPTESPSLAVSLDPQGLLLNFFKEMDEASRGAASP